MHGFTCGIGDLLLDSASGVTLAGCRATHAHPRDGTPGAGGGARGLTLAGGLIRFALEWALKSDPADWIAIVDTDGFVCPAQLACVLSGLPAHRVFYGYFHDRWPNRVECRADANFQVFTRDLLAGALRFFNSTFWDDNDNWGKGNFGFYLRHLWAREDRRPHQQIDIPLA